MICFLLAAGFGKRMEELTIDLPKPLLKINSKTFLDYSIEFAKKLNFKEFIINTHYKAEKIHEYVKKFIDIKIHLSFEKEILGTAGGIFTALKNINYQEDYLVIINPDLLYIYPEEMDFNSLKNEIYSFRGKCLLFLKEKPIGDKNTSLNLENNLVSFTEGPYYYIGFSIIHKEILKYVKYNSYFDLSNIFKELAEKKQLNGKIFPTEVIDLGDKEKYLNYIQSIEK